MESSAHSVTLRTAQPQDNEKLIELARMAPMRGNLEVYSERQPDYFAFTRLQADSACVWVAEESEQEGKPEKTLLGSSVELYRNERIGSDVHRRMHMGDVRVNPFLRRRQVGGDLFRHMKRHFLESDCSSCYFEIMGGNEAALNALKILSPEMEAFQSTDANFWVIPVLFKPKFDKQYTHRRAREDDLEEIEELLRQSFARYVGAPDVYKGWLRDQLSRHPSFSIEDVFVATSAGGDILATTSLWNQSGIRSYRVNRIDAKTKMILRGMSLAKTFVKLPPLPQVGGDLHYAFFRYLGALAHQQQALTSLLRYVLAEEKRQGHLQFAAVCMHPSDPLYSCLDGIFKTNNLVHIFQYARKGADVDLLRKSFDSRTPYLDFALV